MQLFSGYQTSDVNPSIQTPTSDRHSSRLDILRCSRRFVLINLRLLRLSHAFLLRANKTGTLFSASSCHGKVSQYIRVSSHVVLRFLPLRIWSWGFCTRKAFYAFQHVYLKLLISMSNHHINNEKNKNSKNNDNHDWLTLNNSIIFITDSIAGMSIHSTSPTVNTAS